MARLGLWDREEWSINALRCTGRLGWDWRGGAVQQSDATARRIEEEEVRSARGQEKRDRELVFSTRGKVTARTATLMARGTKSAGSDGWGGASPESFEHLAQRL